MALRFLNIVLLWGLSSVAYSSGAEVKLGQTSIIGSDVPLAKGEFFGGIPYAEPPVGKLRFARPVAKFSLGICLSMMQRRSEGLAHKQLPLSYRYDLSTGMTWASDFFFNHHFEQSKLPVSEDCLTLNVFRPADLKSSALLPVMAWIFGGSFLIGTTTTFNASALVAHSISRETPVSYVSFSYRLGLFGFPQGPEAANQGLLNLGLRDQMMALEWIQKKYRRVRW
ncbi:Alpha/Beta hydrolase protein [Mycena vitilis]|nr:Alpha/Beta hydrolase protein [Mycena vitilis]